MKCISVQRRMITHINLDVEILEVESVLPDVDPDDRDES
jgi:hypothetical protein